MDLLVILPFEGKAVAKSVEMRLKVRPLFPVDLLVRTPEKIRSGWRSVMRLFRVSWKRARYSMKPITAEWVDKAGGDFATTDRNKLAEQLPSLNDLILDLET